MMTIIIPPELGISAPHDMPFIELAVTLANNGYTLRNQGNDLVAVPMERLPRSRPSWEEIVKSADPLIPLIVEQHKTYRPPLSEDAACRYCGQKKLFRCSCKRDLDNGV